MRADAVLDACGARVVARGCSLDNGDVEFRLKAYSRSATSGPLWLRLGFRLVGRRQQLAFYRNVCRRMGRLTESQLEMADVTRREERSG